MGIIDASKFAKFVLINMKLFIKLKVHFIYLNTFKNPKVSKFEK